MTALYLFCLIVGGGLLVFSLVLGHEGDAPDADLDLDVEADLDGADAHAEGPLLGEFFSVRTLIYFLAGFGATGFLLESLTGASAPVALAWALLTGLFAAAVAGLLYGWLRRTESGVVERGVDRFAGLPAEVVLPLAARRRGKVRAIRDGREVELLARLYGAEDGDCPRGSTVVIVEMDGDTALVTPAASLPQDTLGV